MERLNTSIFKPESGFCNIVLLLIFIESAYNVGYIQKQIAIYLGNEGCLRLPTVL
jgi:hypothetical protein